MAHQKLLQSIDEFQIIVENDIKSFPLEDCITSQEYFDRYLNGLMVYLITEKENDIGYYAIGPMPEYLSYNGIYLQSYCVFPKNKNKGYGKEILNIAIKPYNNVNIYASVRKDNIASLKTLTKFNFVYAFSYDEKWDCLVKTTNKKGCST